MVDPGMGYATLTGFPSRAEAAKRISLVGLVLFAGGLAWSGDGMCAAVERRWWNEVFMWICDAESRTTKDYYIALKRGKIQEYDSSL